MLRVVNHGEVMPLVIIKKSRSTSYTSGDQNLKRFNKTLLNYAKHMLNYAKHVMQNMSVS